MQIEVLIHNILTFTIPVNYICLDPPYKITK